MVVVGAGPYKERCSNSRVENKLRERRTRPRGRTTIGVGCHIIPSANLCPLRDSSCADEHFSGWNGIDRAALPRVADGFTLKNSCQRVSRLCFLSWFG